MLIRIKYGDKERVINPVYPPQIGWEVLFDQTIVQIDRIIQDTNKHELIFFGTEKIKPLEL